MRKIINCLILLLLTVLVSQADAAVKVWAIGDGIRIDPESGVPIEQQQTYWGPVVAENYRADNWVWDGSTQTISLKAARNEIVSCQVIIETDRQLTGVNLSASELSGPKESKIPATRVQLFREWYNLVAHSKPTRCAIFNLKSGWYPDALIPLDASVHGAPFNIPSDDFYSVDDEGSPIQTLTTQTNQAVWLDLYVPDNSASGIYRGTLTVTAENEPDQVLNIELEVFDFSLPDEFHTTFEFMDYGRVTAGPEDLELKIFRMAQKHRVTISSTKMMPDTVGHGYDVKLDWQRFDSRWGKYLDGSAFVDGPGKGQPLRHVLLPFDARIWRPDKKMSWKGKNWPFPIPGDKGTQEVTKEYAKAFSAKLLEYEKHFDRRGWTSTRLMYWPDGVDEPGLNHGEIGLRPMQLAKKFGELLRQSGTKHTWYRLDIGGGMWSTVDLDGDGNVSPGVLESVNYMKDVVDVWNVHGQCIDPSVLNMRPGSPWKDVWFYNGFPLSVGSMVVTGESLGFRTWQWAAWKYGIGGACDWEFGRPGGLNVFRQAGGMPEVTLEYLRNMYIYPGEQIDLPGEPIPSIRLKMIRRGNQDYEYFHLLTQKLNDGGREANRVVDGIVKRGFLDSWPRSDNKPKYTDNWSHKPAEWYRARLELARLIGH